MSFLSIWRLSEINAHLLLHLRVLSNLLKNISVHKYCSHYCDLSIGHQEASSDDSAPLFLSAGRAH